MIFSFIRLVFVTETYYCVVRLYANVAMWCQMKDPEYNFPKQKCSSGELFVVFFRATGSEMKRFSKIFLLPLGSKS